MISLRTTDVIKVLSLGSPENAYRRRNGDKLVHPCLKSTDFMQSLQAELRFEHYSLKFGQKKLKTFLFNSLVLTIFINSLLGVFYKFSFTLPKKFESFHGFERKLI